MRPLWRLPSSRLSHQWRAHAVRPMGPVLVTRGLRRHPRLDASTLMLRSDDVMLTKTELATRLLVSTKTIERSCCPYLQHEQRKGATGKRFRRRYVERIALTFFSARIVDPRPI
ncbi:hypothetical protein [Gemmatimonas sp.]|jgi:hypothetical protein|uniref:hypothetical protein n=1 Tax=Gemmatimonas sp. TaxID=1962908 RepID=UPI00286DFA08|nr:hypothetical protein [Gemmatimonas sp.]